MTTRSHVLIVEDSELVADALRMLFESADWRVSVAHDVAGAIAAGSADPAALVLLDLTLPDGDGLGAIAPLRASGATTFVALTGHDDSLTRRRCLDAGCTEVLVKPVPVRELLQKASAWRG